MEAQRILNLRELLKKKSFFLFGPRSTGKTHLIQAQLSKDAKIIDLLKSDAYLRLSANPGDLELMVSGNEIIVIDEIQKIPQLLDEVHWMIENKKYRFLLTGSSARKLKAGHANLLAGRAWVANLFPLTWKEIPDFNLNRYLRFGGLPNVYLSQDPEEELNAYARTYLYEEIQAEGLVRKIPAFSRFLKTAAISNGQLLNFAQIGSDAGVSPSTVREYYSILEDTMLGFMLEPWIESKKRKAIATAKFYFFDTGVTHTLAQTKTIDRNSDLYGRSFEQWIGMELRAYLGYNRILDNLTFWRSAHQHEVDYLIGDHTAIEVKASAKITDRDLRNLRALQEEKTFRNYFIVSADQIETTRDGIKCFYWGNFLNQLWSGKMF